MAKSNPPPPLSAQVYKATGEEFLKIAGGQISVFLSLLSLLHLGLKARGKRLSVNTGRILFHGFLASLRKNKNLPHVVKSSLIVTKKRKVRLHVGFGSPSPVTSLLASHPSDSPAAYLSP